MSDPLTLEELDEIFENSLDVVAFGYHHVEQDDMQKIYNAARRGLESADEIDRLTTVNDQLNECILNTKKDVLDDIREWAKPITSYNNPITDFDKFLDAYAKENDCE
jgi:hypothetical protein